MTDQTASIAIISNGPRNSTTDHELFSRIRRTLMHTHSVQSAPTESSLSEMPPASWPVITSPSRPNEISRPGR